MENLIDIRHLSIYFKREGSYEKIVDGISFSIRKGEILGLSGKSGSGKTLSALSLIGLVPSEARVELSATYRFSGGDEEVEMPFEAAFARELRRTKIAFVFQQAASYMNPLLRVGKQIAECSQAGMKEKKAGVLSILEELGFEEPGRIYRSYPHQLSVGQQQRAMLAMAVIRKPELIIADEPFAGIDRLTAQRLKVLIRKLNKERGLSFLIISHDNSLLEDLADRQLQLKTSALYELDNGLETVSSNISNNTPNGDEILLTVHKLKKSFKKGRRISLQRSKLDVLKNISFELRRGERLAVMGKSGTGKSTLALILAGLMEAEEGSMELEGKPLTERKYNGLFGAGPSPVQVVFQDPYSSFDPSKSVAAHFGRSEAERAKLIGLMRDVSLEPGLLARRPYQLSGGQLQRLAFVGCLMSDPALLICDESFSALDRATSEKLFSLLNDQYRELSMVVLTHLPYVARQLCDRIIVLKEGEIEESGTVTELFESPKSDWTARILGLNKF